ncbi:hypothetical protein EBB07_24975 [Paenibacillaceae bacterium]|nr:hypothetical protein EBB07_24975 [Paenibacillaceae bacterium]
MMTWGQQCPFVVWTNSVRMPDTRESYGRETAPCQVKGHNVIHEQESKQQPTWVLLPRRRSRPRLKAADDFQAVAQNRLTLFRWRLSRLFSKVKNVTLENSLFGVD